MGRNRSVIAVSSDHRGISLKQTIIDFLKSKGLSVENMGPDSEASVDYPDYALKTAEAVSAGKVDLGIVICHSGIGVSVTANKVKKVRAALCQTVGQAELARKHTDANILALPAGFINKDLALQIIDKWLETSFEGGRHERRLEKIRDIEDNRK